MSDNNPRGGLVGFMSTVPGLLTAVAALLTAAGGIYLGVHKDAAASAPAPVTIALPTPTQAPPPVGASGTQALRLSNSSQQLIESGSGDASGQLIGQCAQGDESACQTILQYLIQGCTNGDGTSCDALYVVSPAGSDIEEYGATCGYRLPDAYAGTCEQQ